MTASDVRAWLRAGCSRGRLTVVGTLLVLGLGAAFLVRGLDADAVIGAVRDADPMLLGAALVAYLVSWPVRGRRYGDVLAAMGRRCRTGFLTATVFASQTANLVIPARAGDGVRAYLLKDRRDVPYPTGIASLAVERAFDLVAIASLGGVAFAFLLLGGRSIDSGESVGAAEPATALAAAVAIATAAVLLSAATVAVARSDRRFGPGLRARVERPRLARVVDAAVRFGASVRVVAADPRSVGTVFVWSAVVWALDVVTAVLVLAALVGGIGGLVPTATLLVVGTLAVSVGNLAKVLPLSQGGIGLYEAAFTGLVVSATGLPVETALAAAILDHALKNAVTLAGGGIAALALGLSPTAGPAADGEPTPSVQADGGSITDDSR
ncbi:lysylphosphatidylglycerol synthase transmembrane domain-containing protein [Halorubrum sp. AD140]|uniref:lysylphosphatidylglycerol synthase transmembrane domain-containing protein n=1 Tax=Halorubrum sp. AD140 TaxID=3050073 RepID=UPI002ACD1ECD|nr:lysylphosphatidylglycerol synthase transmembrane domain-containing protein [Halorubrum sp. AD140]MDZ5810183.1 lysylphosphatidylglycerol synthase transmembrane domain-containing protein [Halorubrum sp. AD140]